MIDLKIRFSLGTNFLKAMERHPWANSWVPLRFGWLCFEDFVKSRHSTITVLEHEPDPGGFIIAPGGDGYLLLLDRELLYPRHQTRPHLVDQTRLERTPEDQAIIERLLKARARECTGDPLLAARNTILDYLETREKAQWHTD